VGRAINKLIHDIEKYKIRSCIIYLLENQTPSLSIHGGEKWGSIFIEPWRYKEHLYSRV